MLTVLILEGGSWVEISVRLDRINEAPSQSALASVLESSISATGALMIRSLLTSVAMLSATAANCADLGGLPRSAFLGTQLAPAGEGSVQPVVRGVIPQSTAAALKLHPADVLVEINGAATPDVPSAVAAAGRLKAGQPIKIEIKRGGQALTLEGRAIGKPLESYPNVNVTY